LRERPEKRRFVSASASATPNARAKGRKARSPGAPVQIDTPFVNLRPDKPIKHFTAYDPLAKWTPGHVSTEASANAAKVLLGSEFMAAFEDPLLNKPSRAWRAAAQAADLNGTVERAQCC
jgi:putative transposase